MLACAGFGGYARLGGLVCTICRLDEMQASQPATQSVIRMATGLALGQVVKKKETTSRNNLSFEKLRSEFLSEALSDGGTMAEPGDSESSTAAMIWWIITSGRGSQLAGILLNMRAYFVSVKKESVMDCEVVKAAVMKAVEMNPGRPLPKTTGTSELARRFFEVIPLEAHTEMIGLRESLTSECEVMFGDRIGALAGAQVGHGVFANHMAITTWVGGKDLVLPPHVSSGDVFVEHVNDTSKTSLGRVVCCRGESRGPARVQLADTLREYWRVAGLPLSEPVILGGFRIERPDFWVVQLGTTGLRLAPERMASVRTWLVTTKVATVRSVGNQLNAELRRLCEGKNPKESQMFLNVVGGALAGPEIQTASLELTALGVPFTVTKGPLLMKTCGVKKGERVNGKPVSIVLPMPILVGSTYPFLNRCLDRAYAELSALGPVDVQLGGDRDSPDWGHYTWRRLAASSAQACYARGECKEEDVDLYMGWRLAKWAKQMRLHYSDRGLRTSRAHLTESI